MTVSELGERGVLARIRERLAAGRPSSDVLVGIGDDAAVVTLGRAAGLVATTDAQVEGVHFDQRLSTAFEIGYRALAVNLSDIAAMGASARWALLSLVVPESLSVSVLDGLVEGVDRLAMASGVTVVGGNLSRSPGPIVIDITAFGAVHPRRILLRSGGRPGDALYVSGTVGAAAAGLAMLRAGGVADADAAAQACLERYRRPEPRLDLGRAIAHARAARAAIDLSDGLSAAACQLAEASGCGVELDGAAIPVAPGATRWWAAHGRDALAESLIGGDDYELLLAVPRTWGGRLRHARSRAATPSLTRIGTLVRDVSVRHLRHADGRRDLLAGGFAHFDAQAERR